MSFYAIKGLPDGNHIVNTWSEAFLLVNKKSCKYKKFKTIEEANEFLKESTINTNTNTLIINKKSKPKMIEPNHLIDESCIKVWVDGSTPGNGTIYAIGGYGIYFGENDSRNASILLPKSEKMTINICELKAATHALQIINQDDSIKKDYPVKMFSDSTYVTNGLKNTLESIEWNENRYSLEYRYFLLKNTRYLFHKYHYKCNL